MNRILNGIILILLILLVWLSLHLAANRIFQVDECTEVYTARIVASGQGKEHAIGMALLQFPLSWVAKSAPRSEDLIIAARFIMVEVFWLNIVLLAVATGEKLLSTRGLLALMGAATLAPLWDYGFEIRHDNLMLTGLLLTWCLVRVRPSGWQSYFGAGMLAVILQFTAHKAFAYVIPLTLAIFVFPPPGHKLSRLKLITGWVIGAAVAFGALRFLYALHGVGESTATVDAGVKFVSSVSVGDNRFWPWIALSRLPGQSPLLLALVVGALAALLVELYRRGKLAFNWDSCLPEAVLFLGALGILFVNPTPFPYNLLHLVPFAFLLAFRYASRLWEEIARQPKLLLVSVTIMIFTHLTIFGLTTRRHLDWTNARQTTLMNLAEELTDPVKDPVFDGVLLVSSRPMIHSASFLHSLSVHSVLQKDAIHIADMLAARPAAVIIQNYRTDWLRKEDHNYIREHYVPLADDFWVLGKMLPVGGGTFEIIHAGRYQITPKEASYVAGTFETNAMGLIIMPVKTNCTATLDGVALTGKPVELSVGTHRLETGDDCQPAVVWVGPRLERLQPMSDSDHRRLFVNWY